MKTYAPSYFPLFRCLMGACRHSCCIGWEIDIDDNTYRKYAALDACGAEILPKLEKDECGAHIALKPDGRCPFLTDGGLCRLIIDHGEDVLSDICTDHPRFRSYFTGITEIGLGLSCEAASMLVLSQKDPFSLILLSDDGEMEDEMDEYEEEIYLLRNRLLEIARDRAEPIDMRIRKIMEMTDCAGFSMPEMVSYLKTLERLDDAWLDLLSEIENEPAAYAPIDPALFLPAEQFLSYLLFRHMPEALETCDEQGAALLCCFLQVLFITLVNRRIKSGLSAQMEDICEIARMISSEIEYSDENGSLIIQKLYKN